MNKRPKDYLISKNVCIQTLGSWSFRTSLPLSAWNYESSSLGAITENRALLPYAFFLRNFCSLGSYTLPHMISTYFSNLILYDFPSNFLSFWLQAACHFPKQWAPRRCIMTCTHEVLSATTFPYLPRNKNTITLLMPNQNNHSSTPK